MLRNVMCGGCLYRSAQINVTKVRGPTTVISVTRGRVGVKFAVKNHYVMVSYFMSFPFIFTLFFLYRCFYSIIPFHFRYGNVIPRKVVCEGINMSARWIV